MILSLNFRQRNLHHVIPIKWTFSLFPRHNDLLRVKWMIYHIVVSLFKTTITHSFTHSQNTNIFIIVDFSFCFFVLILTQEEILGKYQIDLPGVSTIKPYSHMFERCGALPPLYIRTPPNC
jgi:hypothetical protein